MLTRPNFVIETATETKILAYRDHSLETLTYLLIPAKFHEYLLPFFSNDLPETFGQNEWTSDKLSSVNVIVTFAPSNYTAVRLSVSPAGTQTRRLWQNCPRFFISLRSRLDIRKHFFSQSDQWIHYVPKRRQQPHGINSVNSQRIFKKFLLSVNLQRSVY